MKETTSRIITGTIITLIGAGAMLSTLGVFPFWDHFKVWWPLLLVVAGIFTLIGEFRRNFIWGATLILIGALLTLKNIDVLSFNVFSLIVPIAIMSVGFSILFTAKNRSNVKSTSIDSDSIAAVFSGSESINSSKDYEGGSLTAVFGGIDLDLRDAKIKDKATLDVFVLCGGIELKVPKDWKVVVKATPILGGTENKSRGQEDHKGPVLIITGTVALGGVEVK